MGWSIITSKDNMRTASGFEILSELAGGVTERRGALNLTGASVSRLWVESDIISAFANTYLKANNLPLYRHYCNPDLAYMVNSSDPDSLGDSARWSDASMKTALGVSSFAPIPDRFDSEEFLDWVWEWRNIINKMKYIYILNCGRMTESDSNSYPKQRMDSIGSYRTTYKTPDSLVRSYVSWTDCESLYSAESNGESSSSSGINIGVWYASDYNVDGDVEYWQKGVEFNKANISFSSSVIPKTEIYSRGLPVTYGSFQPFTKLADAGAWYKIYDLSDESATLSDLNIIPLSEVEGALLDPTSIGYGYSTRDHTRVLFKFDGTNGFAFKDW